jgi:hypothetical protein
MLSFNKFIKIKKAANLVEIMGKGWVANSCLNW